MISGLTVNVGAFKSNSACVIIPTLNEGQSIAELIDEIEEIKSVDHVILVDDNSTDNTLPIVQELMKTYRNISLIRRKNKKGIGSAITEGMTKSLTLGPLPDYVITMDADLSHDPRIIPELIRHSVKVESDVAIASRYISDGSITGWSIYRKVISASANALTRFVLRLPVKDCTSGFKCYTRHAIKTLLPALKGEGYEFQIETLHEASRKHLILTEIPMTFSERRGGRSKLGKKEVLRFLLYLIRNVLK